MAKKPRPTKREKFIRTGAIVIVLALLLSLLAGALSFAPATSAAAAQVSVLGKSVQVFSADQELVDTDGDGVENNADPDVDGDGLVNGEDPDIDGDGIENFEDADPIDTTDVDSNAPQKPIRPAGSVANTGLNMVVILLGLGSVVALAITVFVLGKRRGN